MPAPFSGGGHTTIEHERRNPIARGNQRKDHSPLHQDREADRTAAQKAMKALLAQMKKQHEKQKIPHGKQTLKQLMKQNAGVSNIEITKDNIKAFESTAKKYGIDFALKKTAPKPRPAILCFSRDGTRTH